MEEYPGVEGDGVVAVPLLPAALVAATVGTLIALPAIILVLLIPLAAMILEVVVPYFVAMAPSVSPPAT